jgi:hypothetical protein
MSTESITKTIEITIALPLATTFSPAQWRALKGIRTRYRQDRDLFSEAERARLRFVRWLYESGRLVP